MEVDDVNYPGWLTSEKCICCAFLMLPAAAFSLAVSVLILLLLRMVLMMHLEVEGECMLVGKIWWYGLFVVGIVVFLLVMGVWVVARRGRALPDFMSEERRPLVTN